jgi:peptidyl-tRNA hydrolase, PTH1 family
LIVGLGNPGREHANARHNVGFMVADALAARWRLSAPRKRFSGRIAQGRLDASARRAAAAGRPRVALLWPQTYMNAAGRSVGPARGALRLALDRVIVIHDEIDLPFGEVRTRLGGGLAGHNGLKSVKAALGSGDFMRVRVGVGRPASSDPEVVSSYVLGRFGERDQAVGELIAQACDQVEGVVLGPGPDAPDASSREGAPGR